MNRDAELSNLTVFDSGADLVAALAGRIADRLRDAIRQRGQAYLAVSGGSTPVPLFEKLSQELLEWQHVLITLVDERWVGPLHVDSNERLVRTHLLQNGADKATFISLKSDADSPFLGQPAIEVALSAIDGPFDTVVLGMGADGHTASFFSESESLQQALYPDGEQCCCGIFRADLAHPRMTLTLPRILNARQLFLHTSGDEKLDVIYQAAKPGATALLPIRAILNQNSTPLDIFHARCS